MGMTAYTFDKDAAVTQLKDTTNNPIDISDPTKQGQARDLEVGMAEYFETTFGGDNATTDLNNALTAIDGNTDTSSKIQKDLAAVDNNGYTDTTGLPTAQSLGNARQDLVNSMGKLGDTNADANADNFINTLMKNVQEE